MTRKARNTVQNKHFRQFIYLVSAVAIVVTSSFHLIRTNVNEAITKRAESGIVGIKAPQKVGDVTFTVHGMDSRKTVGDTLNSRNAKHKYLVLDVSAKNDGTEPVKVKHSYFTLALNDTVYESDKYADMYLNDNDSTFLGHKVAPGESIRGKVIFDVSDRVAYDDDTQLNVQVGIERGIVALAD